MLSLQGALAGCVSVRPQGARWGQAGRRVVPGAQVAKNLLPPPRVMNHGDDPHRVLTDRVMWLIMLHLELVSL